jgi:hypothetical protein
MGTSEIARELGLAASTISTLKGRIRGRAEAIRRATDPRTAQTVEPATPAWGWGRYRRVGYLWLPHPAGIGGRQDATARGRLVVRHQADGAPIFGPSPLV